MFFSSRVLSRPRARPVGVALACAVLLAAGCDKDGSRERKPLEEPARAPRKVELPQIVGSAPGKLGQEVAFNIGAASDYFNALTAFEMVTHSEGSVEGGGDRPRSRTVDMFVRQDHGDDFQFDLGMSMTGSAEFDGATGMTVLRKDGYFYFKVAEQEKFFRRKVASGTELSRLIKTDALQAYLDFLQRTAKFAVGRDTHLGRPVRVYTVVETIPIDEVPDYQGPDLASSDVRGFVWVDEGSGLVVKVDVTVTRESLDAGMGPARSVERETLEITKIGDITPIETPEKYHDGRDEYSTPEMEVPALLGR